MGEHSAPEIPEIPIPDYDDPKEIYAVFGLAVYCAQLVEQGLVNLIVGSQVVRKGTITWGDVQSLYDRSDRKTLGQLLTDAKQLVPLEPQLEGQLQEALRKRNYLVHHFFVENAEGLLDTRARRRMIDELGQIIRFLKSVDIQVDELWLPLWSKHGITEERIEGYLSDLKRASDMESENT